ncbi:MAG: hypothetical protein BroJett014_00470 [Planctomycetota bacterium]|nr:hypothetical protein [Planctomycetota bacterium]GIK51074.1 MAG: hypothetical protein BroJett014_00470 [Planctomycetota bacterium]
MPHRQAPAPGPGAAGARRDADCLDLRGKGSHFLLLEQLDFPEEAAMRMGLLACVFFLANTLTAVGFDLAPVSPQRSAGNLFSGHLEVAGNTKDEAPDFGDFSLYSGLGLLLDPVGFGWNIESDFWLAPVLAVGSRLSIGVGDETLVLGFAPVVKGAAPVPAFERTMVYAFLGPGLAYVSHTSDKGSRDSEVGFLLTFGVGIDIHFIREFSIGGGLAFDWLVTRPADEGFTMTLEFLRLGVHF